ncbi:hypothetical protein AVEN_168195-1 [Araneus ventricosus]|uniref:Uncharacterized protein n=1 Tax=Araneus ventricosus TaxID=182803 RepID=A0A4Y2QGV4_ARAVE|nr:hypothetical protein AVEN_168195-1 [Araneus ventricosus]
MMCRAYDPEMDSWISLPAPNIFCERFSTVAVHEQLFAISGGNNEGKDLKNIEVYDPLQNTWMSLHDLPFKYLLPGSVIVDDQIIVYEKKEEISRSPCLLGRRC